MTNIFSAHPRDRVQAFIDGPNLYGAIRNLGRKVIWSELRSLLESETRLIRPNYFATYRPSQATESFFGMLNYIEKAGFTVTSKEVNEKMDEMGRISMRGTMVGEMTAAMVNSAHTSTDHIILFSGDSELYAAVSMCKSLDCRVTLVSTDEVTSRDMRQLADNYISLLDLPKSVLVEA